VSASLTSGTAAGRPSQIKIRDERQRVPAALGTMLDKILFWVVLVWMVALLVMAVRAVREVWKEDSRETAEPDAADPSRTSAADATKPDNSSTGQ